MKVHVEEPHALEGQLSINPTLAQPTTPRPPEDPRACSSQTPSMLQQSMNIISTDIAEFSIRGKQYEPKSCLKPQRKVGSLGTSPASIT
eukprot:1873106-Amphidinium_carterae.1